jgi:hypothetical protein
MCLLLLGWADVIITTIRLEGAPVKLIPKFVLLHCALLCFALLCFFCGVAFCGHSKFEV